MTEEEKYALVLKFVKAVYKMPCIWFAEHDCPPCNAKDILKEVGEL